MAWPGAEAVERGAHCQGHTGMGDTDRKARHNLVDKGSQGKFLGRVEILP